MPSNQELQADLVVVGAGAAGLTAAVAAAEAGVKNIIMLESGTDVAGTVPEIYDVLAPVEKGRQGWPPPARRSGEERWNRR